MSIENLINNTRPVANGYINDQLKWRRERIETLTKELGTAKALADSYKQLYHNELSIVKQFLPLIEKLEQLELLGENDIKISDTLKKHLQSHNYYNKIKK
jgi:hypothetical protein